MTPPRRIELEISRIFVSRFPFLHGEIVNIDIVHLVVTSEEFRQLSSDIACHLQPQRQLRSFFDIHPVPVPIHESL